MFRVEIEHAWFAERDTKAAKGQMASRAYDWGFLTATAGVLQCLQSLPDPYTVDFVFDEGRKEFKACRDWYYEAKRSGKLDNLEHAGSCEPGDDRFVAELQMADLIAGEYSYVCQNGFPCLEPFAIITNARQVIRVNCNLPPQIPERLAIQKLGAQVKRKAEELLREGKKGIVDPSDYLQQIADLRKQEAFFWLEFQKDLRDI